MKTAIITGVRGQDGSYLSDILLARGYKVIGVARRSGSPDNWRIEHLRDNKNFILEFGDVTDSGNMRRLIQSHSPDEFYHLAAQSFVGVSWSEPIHTSNATGLATLVCLEALRDTKPDTKFYNAASSEMFGRVLEPIQSEKTPFNPISPYAAAKCFGFHCTKIYRESYGMFACNGILFNHESERRGLEFVTRKITDGVARIASGKAASIALGNLDSERDWGHAADYCEAMAAMLSHTCPDDYVVATGEKHTIREFLSIAFSRIGLDWRQYVTYDERFSRPNDVTTLCGNATKAKNTLSWSPQYSFVDLVNSMVDADIKRHKNAS